jgi:predicted branched-subunit amino acid permease
MSERWSDLRNGLVLGFATVPLALVVAKVGLQSGLGALEVLATSALVSSAAVQLILYQIIAAPNETTPLAWVLIVMVSLRLVLYSCDLNQAIKTRPLQERLASAFFIGDTAYLEFKRLTVSGQDACRALARFKRVSRSMWACWQGGTMAGVWTGITLPGLPKEAVSVLIFSCLALTVFWPSKPARAM